MDDLKWEAELVEKISEPAKKAVEGLKELKTESAGADDGLKSVGEASESSGVELNAYAEIASKVVEAIKAIANATIESVKFIENAQDFKQDTVKALEILGQSHDEALATFGALRDISNESGVDVNNLKQWQIQLERIGLSVSDAQDVIKGGLDYGALSGDPQQAQEIINQITSLKAKGVTDERSLKAMSTMVDKDMLLQNLADAKGTTVQGIQEMMKAGKITGDEGAAALMATIKEQMDKGDPLGSLSKEMNENDLDTQFKAMKNNIAAIFEDGGGDGPSGFVLVLQKINEILKSSSVKSFGEDIMSIFAGVADGILAVMPYVEAIAGPVWDGIKEAVGPLVDEFKKLMGSGGPDSQVIKGIKMLGEAFGFVTGILIDAVAIVGAVVLGIAAGIDWLVAGFGDWMVQISDEWDGTWERMGSAIDGLIDSITSPFTSFVDGAGDIAGDFIDGLVQGIKDGASSVVTAITDMADDAVQSAKDALGIASPSKVLAEVGDFTAAGFAKGVNDNDAPQAAMEDMVEPPTVTGSQVAAGAAGGGGGGGSMINLGGLQLSLQVDGAGKNGEQVAQDALAILERTLPELLEKMLMQAGAAKPEAA